MVQGLLIADFVYSSFLALNSCVFDSVGHCLCRPRDNSTLEAKKMIHGSCLRHSMGREGWDKSNKLSITEELKDENALVDG